jgi:cysteine desulfurase
MQPFLHEEFENPLTESAGAEKARTVIETSREQVARMIHARSSEVLFVSSGTEANNWALKGLAQVWQSKKDHILISAIEHFSVYQTALFLQRQGFRVTILPVDRKGLIDPDEIRKAVTSSTFLVSILAASDEIGVIQDVAGIASLKKDFPEVLFHTDAIQYVCYEDLDVTRLPFDLVSFSSNAIYGPAGIAALYMREGTRIVPLFHGGMQEEGLRPGLQSISLAAGFGKAADINLRQKSFWKTQLRSFQVRILNVLDRLKLPLTGSRSSRLVDNLHIIADVDGEALLTLLLDKNIRASTGSTCYQYAQKESHVLQALGFDAAAARGAVLFTTGIDQSDEDAGFFEEVLTDAIRHLRQLKP